MSPDRTQACPLPWPPGWRRIHPSDRKNALIREYHRQLSLEDLYRVET